MGGVGVEMTDWNFVVKIKLISVAHTANLLETDTSGNYAKHS